jgi:hypothetical protein
MPRRLLIPALLALVVLLAASAVAQAVISQEGNLRISFDGGFSPRQLPRDTPAPVSLSVKGAISTTDGSHPPALRRLEVGLNRHGHLSTVGLPVCTSAQLQSTTTESALARCRPALVGRGHFKAEVAFSNLPPIPAGGRMLAFNGRHGGQRALLLHLYIATPVRATFILPLTISNRAKGQFGTVLTAKVPTLAGGLGSVSQIDLEINRNYTYRGQPRSYLSASCAAPAGFPGAVFTFARGAFHFADGRTLETVLSGDCKVR